MSTWRVFRITHVGHGKLGYVFSVNGRRVGDATRVEHWCVWHWNRLHCAIFGHERILEGIPETYDTDGRFACTACSKRLQPMSVSEETV